MLELLTSPPIPKSLLGINPRRINPSGWSDMRADALARMGGRCAVCSDNQAIEVHETYVYDYDVAIATFNIAIPLCVPCHRFTHLELTASRWRHGEIAQEIFIDCVNHGTRLLRWGGKLPSLVQMGIIRRLTHWPDTRSLLSDDAYYANGVLLPPYLGQDTRQWRLYWNGQLYKEVMLFDYTWNIDALFDDGAFENVKFKP
jgi:hypothetical protein